MKPICEKVNTYVFAAGIALLLAAGMILHLHCAPARWQFILMQRLLPVGCVIGAWLLSRKTELVQRFFWMLPFVKMMAILLPVIVLLGGRLCYHSMLFPFCAVFVYALLCYIFRYSPLELVLISLVAAALLFAVVAVLEGDLPGAVLILAGGAMMIVSTRSLLRIFKETSGAGKKQIVALLILVTGAILIGTLPEVRQALGLLLSGRDTQQFGLSFLEMAFYCFGPVGACLVYTLYCAVLLSGWKLVWMNDNVTRLLSVAAMTALTAWLACDMLMIYEVGFAVMPLGIAVGGSLKIALWLVCAFCVLPPDHLLPGGRRYLWRAELEMDMDDELDREIQEMLEEMESWENFGEEEDDLQDSNDEVVEDICREDASEAKNAGENRQENDATYIFAMLCACLMRPNPERNIPNELELWEMMWFEYPHMIPDFLWDVLTSCFREFCDREGLLVQ